MKLKETEHFPSAVSFLVAYMVAYHREYRYREFQRRRKAGDGAEEASVGMTGASRARAALFTVDVSEKCFWVWICSV